MNYRKEIEKMGYTLGQSAESGTLRWYLDRRDLDYLDRRGFGFRTQRDAYERALENAQWDAVRKTDEAAD